MNKENLETKVKKIKLRKGDLLFISCPNSSYQDLDDLKVELEKNLEEDCSVVFTNFELKVQRRNVLETNILHITCNGNFSYDEFKSLEGTILDQIRNTKEEQRDKKAKIKIILKG
jgi:hypothetical protein